MSDTSQGPGWWRASNGLWYPPEATPGPRPSRPAGVPDRAPADPKVQPPFTPRRVEPLETARDRRTERRAGEARRRVPWGWIGLVLLVVAFGGAGTWLALTAGGGSTSPPSTTGPQVPSSNPDATTTTTTPSTSTSATTAADDLTAVFDIADGDCFTPRASDADGTGTGTGNDDELIVTAVEIVDCDDPHLAEVIAVVELPGDPGEPFPGLTERDAAAQDLCLPAFDDAVGVPLAQSELGLLWFAPTDISWSGESDRWVTCAVQSLDGEPLRWSVVGSER